MTLEQILLVVAVVLSLPGGLFVAYLISEPRARWASILGGLIGAVAVAVAVYYFVIMAKVEIDALSYAFGVFFAASTGVALGALIMNFLVGLVARGRDNSALEF
jgi:hypothetical protein